MPLRWTAPEALCYNEWSEKSDVWSFGVLCYECFTAGALPYLQYSNTDVMAIITNGNYLPPPPSCPPRLYALMVCDHAPALIDIYHTIQSMPYHTLLDSMYDG